MCDSACYFTRRQCVKALRILSTPWGRSGHQEGGLLHRLGPDGLPCFIFGSHGIAFFAEFLKSQLQELTLQRSGTTRWLFRFWKQERQKIISSHNALSHCFAQLRRFWSGFSFYQSPRSCTLAPFQHYFKPKHFTTVTPPLPSFLSLLPRFQIKVSPLAKHSEYQRTYQRLWQGLTSPLTWDDPRVQTPRQPRERVEGRTSQLEVDQALQTPLHTFLVRCKWWSHNDLLSLRTSCTTLCRIALFPILTWRPMTMNSQCWSLLPTSWKPRR